MFLSSPTQKIKNLSNLENSMDSIQHMLYLLAYSCTLGFFSAHQNPSCPQKYIYCLILLSSKLFNLAYPFLKDFISFLLPYPSLFASHIS